MGSTQLRFYKTLIKTKLIDPTHIEVRSYELGKTDLRLIHCADKDYKNHDHIGEDYMILPVSKQDKGIVINTQVSKYPPYSNYLIYRFVWKPTGKVEREVLNPDNITFKDGVAYI